MRERGSVLMLVPAGVLVLVVLGAIAVDSAVAFMAQREISNAAAAAANDAAGAALSDERFYLDGGALVIDPARARVVAARSVAARGVRGVSVSRVDVVVGPDAQSVCVTVEGVAPYVLARALPFVPSSARVTGSAGAVAVAGDAVGARSACR